MKSFFIFGLIFLIDCTRGEPNPNLIVIPRERQSGENPKTIVISHMNGQLSRDQLSHPVMRAVMNAVQSHLKRDLSSSGVNNESNANNSDIPEIVISDTEQQFDPSMYSAPELLRKVYNLPPMTRMIASEEEPESGSKKSPVWRSPMPFLHHNCPHHKHNTRKAKPIKKRNRKQRKPEMNSESESNPTKPQLLSESPEPLRSILMSIISHSIPQPDSDPIFDNEVRPPTGFLMAITRRSDQQKPEFMTKPSEDTMSPSLPMFMALMKRKQELESEPEIPYIPPFNPFLALLAKIHKPLEQKSDFETKEEDKGVKRMANFNFNINFTINNNYPQSQPIERKGIHFSAFPPDRRFSLLRSL